MQCAASVPMEHEMDAPVTTAYVDPFVVVPSSRTLGCAEICEGGQYRRRGEFGWYDYAKGPGSQPTLEFRPDPYCTLRLSDLERFYSVRTDDVTPEMHAMLEYFTYAEGGLKSHFLICRGGLSHTARSGGTWCPCDSKISVIELSRNGVALLKTTKPYR